MTISLTEQLILGILLEEPQHGYHIEQVIKERGMRTWLLDTKDGVRWTRD